MSAVSRRSLLAAVLLAAAVPAAAQQANDETYASRIREYTSDPRFLPASLTTIPDHPDVPSPLDHFGTIVGAPLVMHRTSEIHGYYRALDEASPRVTIEELGTSEQGNPFILVIIADEQTIGRLDHYREQLALLADPRRIDEARAQQIITDAKPVYYLQGGLHSPEMGSPEMLMEAAYRLAVDERPEIRNIRDNVITIINPVAEPDGRDRQVDWYHRYTKNREEMDDGFPRSSPYWGDYVYHDNNRDGLQVSQALTKAIFEAYYRWHPTVMLDLHESVPLLYISTGTGPYNETIDPISIGEWQVLANHDLTALTAEGLPGVFTWAFYDGWWPGYAIWVANNHNGLGRFYETFGNAGATTYIRDLGNSRYAGDPVTERTWYRPDPATRKVRWSARDNVNYMQAGVMASLGYAADNGAHMLRNFYRKGVNNIERGRTQKPYAFVIPHEQDDPGRAAYLVNQLRRQAIEVHVRASGDSAGDYVVKLDQPYRNLAVTLLSKQDFPADAEHPPYDDIAWTLGYLYGVDVHAVDDSAVFRWPGLQPVTEDVSYEGRVAGTGDVYLIPYRAQNGVAPALYWLREQRSNARIASARASFVTDAVAQDGQNDGPAAGTAAAADTMPAGTIILENVPAQTAAEMARRFAIDLVATGSRPEVATNDIDLPRVAIYHTWYSTQDEGWARYTFEQYGVPYTSIDKDDLRAGNLNRRFDVILVPAVRGGLEQVVHGVDSKWGPMPYTRTDEFPSHGSPDSTDDMTGGPGFEGLANLQAFVRNGGTILTIGGATVMVAESGIARALSPQSTGNLFHPGSVVRAKARRADHPVLYGYPETFQIFRGNGSLYRVDKRDRDMMLLQYGTRPLADEREEDDGPYLGIPESQSDTAAADTAAADTAAADSTATARDTTRTAAREGGRNGDSSYVLSGMVRNENQIIGHGAIFDVPVGQGHVIAYTFNPLHRFLNHHEIPLVWNALLHWNDLRAEGGR